MTYYSNKVKAEFAVGYTVTGAFWELSSLYDDLVNTAWTGGANPYFYDTSGVSSKYGSMQFSGTPATVTGPFTAFPNATTVPAAGYAAPANPALPAYYTFGYFSNASVQFLMKTSVTTGIQTVIAQDNSNLKFKIEVVTTNVVFTVYEGGTARTVTGTVNVANGNWHHVVVTWAYTSPAVLSVYVDGVLDTSASYSQFSTNYGLADMKIGSSCTGTANPFQGSLSGISLWPDYLITSTQVASYYLAAIATFFAPGPVSSRTTESGANLITLAQDVFDFVHSETISSIDSVLTSGGVISLTTTSQTTSTFTLPTAELSDNLPIDMSFYMAGNAITGPVT